MYAPVTLYACMGNYKFLGGKKRNYALGTILHAPTPISFHPASGKVTFNFGFSCFDD